MFSPLLNALGQDPLLRKISVDDDNYIYTFYVSYIDSPIKTQNDVEYHWYFKGKVNKNKGGYTGQLLEDIYEKTTLNGILIEKGEFENGTKSGRWKIWDMHGNILQDMNWKEGKKHGTFWEIDTISEIVTSGKYRNNLLNGNFTKSLNDSIVEKTRYRKGEIVNPIRIQLFKKKDEQKTDNELETDSQPEQIDNDPAIENIEEEI